MKNVKFFNVSTQVADFLRQELFSGCWKTTIPGREKLCEQLRVSPKTIRLALEQLVKEGLLAPGGKGRCHRIVLDQKYQASSLRIGIFPHGNLDHTCRNLITIKYLLQEYGHEVKFFTHSLSELKMQVGRISSHVKDHSIQALVVVAGSRNVLEWFSQQTIPVFALMGSMSGIPIAGAKPDKILAQREALIQLHRLGHRRIMHLCRDERTTPIIGRLEQAFLDGLQRLGLPVGAYNLPTYDGTKNGLHKRLDILFRVTPPTALFIPEPSEFIAIQQYLARRGVFAPEKISLICNDPDPVFSLSDPVISHIAWNFNPLANRITDWAQNIAKGKIDTSQTLTKAAFFVGGTIGKVPSK